MTSRRNLLTEYFRSYLALPILDQGLACHVADRQTTSGTAVVSVVNVQGTYTRMFRPLFL
jgi:hypothetical protein